MKAVIASVFALGLLGASAVPASAVTIHFGSGYHHHHWRGHHYGYGYHHSGYGWRHHYRHRGWRHY